MPIVNGPENFGSQFVVAGNGAISLNVTKADVGLGNVDNTSDLNKPISTATQTALDTKLNLTGGAITGNLTISTTASSTLNLVSPPGSRNQISGARGANLRWVVSPGDLGTESGSNSGSDFSIYSYTDAGAYLGAPLSITRSSGFATFASTVTIGGILGINGVTFASNDGLNTGFNKIYDNSGNITLYLGNNVAQQSNIYAQTQHQFTNRTAAATWALFDTTSTRNVSGAWAVISDPAMKEDVTPYTRGLEAVLGLDPVMFRYRGGTPFAKGVDEPSDPLIGLMADAVALYVPEIVGKTMVRVADKDQAVSTLEPGNLIYALINALKELSARVVALEEATP